VVDRLREARPDIALTTDLIVGFPGETDGDFRDTLELVREVRFVDGYSFRYSPRPGTAAAEFPDCVPPDVAQARLEELQALLRELTLAAHRARVGERTEVLIAGPSRRGGRQLSGRDPYHRIVNFDAQPSEDRPAGEGARGGQAGGWASEGLPGAGLDPRPERLGVSWPASAAGASPMGPPPGGALPTPVPGSLVPVRILAATPHSLLGRLEGADAPPAPAPLKSGRR
jgi:hypothetical protein